MHQQNIDFMTLTPQDIEDIDIAMPMFNLIEYSDHY